ncbi:hypothetical protein [Salegentibacter sp. Hel_I_6]|uniref:hypothetical protein n=1 Tax=Salegentibacter sp. Hel_I_6 TaxID=1250278 RepID=UPI00055F9BA6|nr:hypothetical protein [Salegentibacter sp. Hel_I_6]
MKTTIADKKPFFLKFLQANAKMTENRFSKIKAFADLPVSCQLNDQKLKNKNYQLSLFSIFSRKILLMTHNVPYKNCARASVIFRRKIRRSKQAGSFDLRRTLALFLYVVELNLKVASRDR